MVVGQAEKDKYKCNNQRKLGVVQVSLIAIHKYAMVQKS